MDQDPRNPEESIDDKSFFDVSQTYKGEADLTWLYVTASIVIVILIVAAIYFFKKFMKEKRLAN